MVLCRRRDESHFGQCRYRCPSPDTSASDAYSPAIRESGSQTSSASDVAQVVDNRLLSDVPASQADVAVGADQDQRVPRDAVGGVDLLISVEQGMFGGGDRVIWAGEGIHSQNVIKAIG